MQKLGFKYIAAEDDEVHEGVGQFAGYRVEGNENSVAVAVLIYEPETSILHVVNASECWPVKDSKETH